VFNPLDTSGVNMDDDPPPPFKEFESPVHPPGANFSGGVDDGKGPGEQVAEGSHGERADAELPAAEDRAEGEGQEGAVDGDGTKDKIKASQDAGDRTQGTGKNTPERARETVDNSREQGTRKQNGEGNQGAGEGIQGAGKDSQATGKDTKFASEDTHVVGGNTEDADPSLRSEPTPLTQEQREVETNRVAFLLEQVARLEASRNKLQSSDVQGLSEIQARLELILGRIRRTNFADPPKDPSPTPELSAPGKLNCGFMEELTNMIVDLLINRQDIGPFELNVFFPSKNKFRTSGAALRDYVNENKFSFRSDPADGQFVVVITV
jgi:hypothetical protein